MMARRFPLESPQSIKMMEPGEETRRDQNDPESTAYIPPDGETMKELQVDHGTVGGPDLQVLIDAFDRAGFHAHYGGPHGNQITHMGLVPFPDNTYLELISTVDPDQKSPLWPLHIAGDGGPCAFAVIEEDLDSEISRLREASVPIRKTIVIERERPDGAVMRGQLVFVGDHEPGAIFPFLIKDETPRSIRTTPPASAKEPYSPWITGLDTILIGVADLEKTSDKFRKAYGFPAPKMGTEPELDARLARFVGTPVTLASPRSLEGWLSQRIERFGESPCAFLLRTNDPEKAREHYHVKEWCRWSKDRVGFLPREAVPGVRIAIITSC